MEGVKRSHSNGFAMSGMANMTECKARRGNLYKYKMNVGNGRNGVVRTIVLQ